MLFWNSDNEKYSKTVKWTIATYATTLHCNGKTLYVGGVLKKNISSYSIKEKRSFLKKNYGITDKQSADNCMIYLYYGGINFEFYKTVVGAASEMKEYERNERFQSEYQERKNACWRVFQQFPKVGTIALDLSRGMYIASCLYLVGIYSFEECMSVSTQMARKLQANFNSWDEFMANYFLGIECAGEEPHENSLTLSTRTYYYKDLKKQKNGPYSIDWKTTLVDEWNCSSSILEYPDTIKWFNAAKALLKGVNRETPHLYPTMLSSPDNMKLQKKSLKSSWDISNKEDAYATISDLLRGDMHYSRLMEEWEDLKIDIPNNYNKLRFNLIETIITKYEDKGIIAWDWFRALHLASACYTIGYISYEEALDISLVMAKEIQNTFSSWDEYFDNYSLGYQYWSGDIRENPDNHSELKTNEFLNFDNDGIEFRQKLYQWLKNDSESVFDIPWNTELKKEW